MAALYNFQDAYRVGFDLEGNWRSPEDEDRALKYVAEFKTGCALIYIFAGTAAINAVDSYNIDIEIAQRNISFSGRRSAQQSTVAALSRLHERLIGAAREDLHVK